ncbi:MAG: EAL domain-containing protein [Lachnospiraceae bacterium]|nr:EAL domain-containing protein [Lachnospiraceae bacterium]
MQQMKDKVRKIMRRIENLTIVRAVQNGLIHITPIVLIGALALVVRTFPVEAYQQFMSNFLNGALYRFFEVIYGATFGVLSVYMTYSISRAYMKLKGSHKTVKGGAILSSIVSFFILAGCYLPHFGLDQTGAKSMFLAIITGLGASTLYFRISLFLEKRKKNLFLIGANREMNKMLSTLFPIACVTFFFALINTLIIRVFDVDSFRTLLINMFNALFSYGSGSIGADGLGEAGFFKGFLFVLISSVLWFFGVHGNDTLEGVMQTYFVPGVAANKAAVTIGAMPRNILTKEFFDCFVLMGGCGTTICLLIALLLFSKSRVRKGLGLTAALPMCFNINELMVFGLPIIFNTTMLIPFLLTPLVCYSVSYAAIALGLVPKVITEVAWTTPILLGGFRATGSIAGALLQLLNVILGVLIYTPFVKRLDNKALEEATRNYDAFMKYYKENEATLGSVRLTELSNVYGDFAKDLCNDLRYGMNKQIVLAYQPQYHYDGHCIGVEALLRWKHPVLDLLYPPLVIKMAEEGGFLAELEEKIVEKVLIEQESVTAEFGEGIKVSVNVTGTTVVTQRFIDFCKKLSERYAIKEKNICIEVTEQAAISFSEETMQALRTLRELGFLLAIDDFSMGQTSVHYLQEDLFDIIKLDGSIVNGLATYDNSRDIILSICQLAKSLDLKVIAEFVDSEEKRSILHEIGCDHYQGFLYSPAVFLKR